MTEIAPEPRPDEQPDEPAIEDAPSTDTPDEPATGDDTEAPPDRAPE